LSFQDSWYGEGEVFFIFIFMKTIAIKIGSSVILTGRNKLDEFRIAHIADQVASLRKGGVGVVLVISGAVAFGANYIDLSEADTRLKKVAAGIGQTYLISIVRKFFSAKKLTVAQVLLTKGCFYSKENQKSIKETLEYYLEIGIIPVINENDVVDLNSFGGNDCLVSEIATMLGLEQVIILSQMSASLHGVGGGKIKQQVITDLNNKGIRASILNGKEKKNITSNIL